MKAPVEISSFQETQDSAEFSEFLWMAEEELEDFDERVYIMNANNI